MMNTNMNTYSKAEKSEKLGLWSIIVALVGLFIFPLVTSTISALFAYIGITNYGGARHRYNYYGLAIAVVLYLLKFFG